MEVSTTQTLRTQNKAISKYQILRGVSECWRFYAVPTARVIFTAKTSFDVFSLSREQVWTFSVLDSKGIIMLSYVYKKDK